MASHQDPTRPDSQALESAFLCLPAPAAILDSEFRFVVVNKAFSTEFEYQPDEIVGRKAEVLYDPSLHEVALNAQQVIHSDSSPDFRFERLIATRSGRVLDTAVHITCIGEGPSGPASASEASTEPVAPQASRRMMPSTSFMPPPPTSSGM